MIILSSKNVELIYLPIKLTLFAIKMKVSDEITYVNLYQYTEWYFIKEIILIKIS